MKKLSVFLLSFSILFVTTTTFAGVIDTAKKTKTSKVKAVKVKAGDKVKETKASTKDVATTATTKASTTAASTEKAATTTAATKATTTKATATKSVTQAVNKSADKAIGTDAKGRTIYLGPKGGKYTLSPSGKKEYIKKTS